MMSSLPSTLPPFSAEAHRHFPSMSLSPAGSSDSGNSWQVHHPMPAEAGASKENERRPAVTPPDASNSLKWVTATKNLDQFKNKETMREVRNHVMVDYLTKRHQVVEPPQTRRAPSQAICPAPTPESRSSSTGDITSRDQALALFHKEGRRRKRSQRSPSGSDSGNRKRVRDEEEIETIESRSSFLVNIDRYVRALRKMRAMAPINQPLVFPRVEALAPFPYDSAFKNLTPLSFDLGRALDPFQTLPQASTAEVNIENLKFHCSRFFGTKAMGVRWVPALLNQRHAFLSTLCIASSHLDIMTGNIRESRETTLLRLEVVQLISQSIANARTQVDDPTIMAVLQLLCSELVRGETKEILWHENGLEQMVNQRGGLHRLGIKPDLAVMMTVIMFLSAISREVQPRQLFLDYAQSLPQDAFSASRPIPESPLYCPRNEFLTVVRSNKCKAETFELLCDVREMIDLFIGSTDPESSRASSTHDSESPSETRAKSPRRPANRIQSLYAKILLLPSAEQTGHDLHNDWTYEACRIAACITATAIAKRVPFSVAATMAAAGLAPANVSSTSSPSQPPSPPQATHQPTLLHSLRSALDKSNLSSCWMEHHLTGVLLWITLIGSSACTPLAVPSPTLLSPLTFQSPPRITASASPTDAKSPSQSSPPAATVFVDAAHAADPSPEDRLLRKWIVAMAIRCCVLLAFEHKGGVVQSLDRMLRVGERLGNARDAAREGVVSVAGPAPGMSLKAAGKRRRT